MQSPCPKLWKQIGSESHRKEYLASFAQNNIKADLSFAPIPNQQICIPFEESLINVKLTDLEAAEIQKDCLEELELFSLGRRLTASSDLVGSLLKEVPDNNRENVNNQRMGANKCRWQPETHEKMIKTLNTLKNANKQLQAQVGCLKFTLRQMVCKMQSSLRNQVNHLHQLYLGQIQTLSLSHINKCLELDYSYKLLEQKQRDHKLALVAKQTELVTHSLEIAKLKKQVDQANKDVLYRIKENTELSQKVFDLEQRLLGFDLKVQQKVQEILTRAKTQPDEFKIHNVYAKQDIENHQFSPFKKWFTQISGSPYKPNYLESNLQYQPKYCQSKFASPKRRESFGMKQIEQAYQEKNPAQNKISAKKSLQRLFSKAMYESQPMSFVQSPTRYSSNSDFYKHEHKTERIKTANSRQLLHGNISVVTKKVVESGKETKVDNISQKLHKIRAKIEKQIKNITVYKQRN